MWIKIKVWVDSYPMFSRALQYIHILIAPFFSHFYGLIFIVFFIFCVIINLVIKMAKEQNKKKNQELEVQNEKLHKIFINVPKYYIRYIYEKLDLSENERFTLYQLSDDKKNLVNLARHSKNASFNEKGRSKYPKNKGVIGICFNKGFYKVSRSLKEKEEKTWINNHYRQYSINVQILKKIKMKSIFYLGKRVEKDNEHLGVVLFESVKELEDSNIKKINKELESSLSFFSNILSNYNDLPDINNAEKKGF